MSRLALERIRDMQVAEADSRIVYQNRVYDVQREQEEMLGTVEHLQATLDAKTAELTRLVMKLEAADATARRAQDQMQQRVGGAGGAVGRGACVCGWM